MSAPVSNAQSNSAVAPKTTVNPVAKAQPASSPSSTTVDSPPGFRQYFLKFLGAESSPGFTMPTNVKTSIITIIAFFCALFLACVIHMYAKHTVIHTGMYLSLFMIFFYTNEKYSQPRAIFLGHVLGALIGLIFNEIIIAAPKCYSEICSVLHQSISVSVTGFLMVLFPDFLHPPALVTAAGTAGIASDRWKYLGTPAIAGSLLIIALGLIFMNIIGRYPRYW